MDPKRVEARNKRKRIQTRGSSIIADSNYISIEGQPDMEDHINTIWNELRNLGNKTTKTVKEAELKWGRNHKDRTAAMSGELGQFRLKEVSDVKTPNVIEICGEKSWQTLSARIPNLYKFKADDTLVSQINSTNAATSAASTKTAIIDLQTKYNNLVEILSNLNIFNLEDIPDENPNIDRDVAARKPVGYN